MPGSNYAYSTGEFLFDAPEFNMPQLITPKTTNQPVFDPEDGMYDAYILARNASIGANASKRKLERFYKKFRKLWDQGEALRKSEFDWNNSMLDINSRLDNIQQNFNTGLSNLVKSTQESVNNRQLISKPVTLSTPLSIPLPTQESAYARAKREGNTRSLVGQDPLAAAAVSAQESGIIPTTRGIGRNEVSVNPDEFGYLPEQLIQTNLVSSLDNSDKPGSWFRKAAQTFEGATGLGKSLNGLFNTLADWRENGWLERNNSRKPIYLLSGRTTQSFLQGGTMGNLEELLKAFMAYLIEDAAAQGMQIQSEQDLQVYAQQLGEEGLKAKYQEFMLKMQGGVKAALGAKLTYINKLKGNCPDGTESYYFRDGGSIKRGCKPCMEKAEKGKKLKEKNSINLWKADRAKAKDEAARDSIAINKYNDLETMINKGNKGKFNPNKTNASGGATWEPDRSKYKTEKKACGSKLKKKEVTKHWGGGAVARGGLTNLQYSGTWGNRGQGNQLQSAIERGLSWLGLGPSLKLSSSYYLVDPNGNMVKELNPVSKGIAPTPGKGSGINKVATLTTKVGQKLAGKVYKKMPGYAKKSEDFYHADGTWAGTKKPLWVDDIDNAFIMESLGGLK